jgi:hypothetical protein
VILIKRLSSLIGKIFHFLIPKFTRSLIFINVKFVGGYFLPTNGEFLLESGLCFISILFTAYIFDLCFHKSRTSFSSKVKKGILRVIITVLVELSSIYSFNIIPVNKLNESELFDELIKLRDSLSKLWEHYNKANDKNLMQSYGKKLDEAEAEIDKYRNIGYIDPAEMPKSAPNSDDE